jgi:hypothetical protein
MFPHFEKNLFHIDMCMRRTFLEAHTTKYKVVIFHGVFSPHNICNSS